MVEVISGDTPDGPQSTNEQPETATTHHDEHASSSPVASISPFPSEPAPDDAAHDDAAPDEAQPDAAPDVAQPDEAPADEAQDAAADEPSQAAPEGHATDAPEPQGASGEAVPDEHSPDAASSDAGDAVADAEAAAAADTEADAEAGTDDTDTDGDGEGDGDTDGDGGESRPKGFPEVITTTTLFFVAPDLPPVTEHVRDDRFDGRTRGRGRAEEPRDDEQRPSESRSSRGDDAASTRSRKRSRNARDRDARGQRETGAEQDDQQASSRAPQREPITEPQKIKGSTRLEAKRQRRREGRETGRRRPVVTESEFLARREGVDRMMLVRAKDKRVQIGVLEDKVLVEHYVARSQESSLIGNVYLGRVQNVLPSMEAAFIDIGRGRNAVLYSGEVDWSAAELGGGQARRIENALKPGDRVLVQVTKDPVGHKGARLTSQVSLPGRYLVYVPGNTMNGISRKLPDTERSRLKKILKEVLPQGVGVIVRTAAEGATREQLERDVNRLTSQWQAIQKLVADGPAPALLHSEPDLLIKIIRDVFNEDFQKLIIQGRAEFDTITTYLGQVAPDLLDRVEQYEGDDVFVTHRATEHIEKALDRKVWLPSGGSLVIDRTEAMTVVDVNTGKFVGSGGNLEETVTKNNLEAAEEVVRQLRLRDIGGIIVIDFIDMVLESNRDLVLRRLVECLSRDRTKHQVAEVTSLGLVQMTRKKLGLGLLETFSEPCATCAGRGVIVHHDPVMKHRSGDDQPSGRGRRGRGGSGGSNDSSAGRSEGAAPSGNGTHGITDEARGALSRIAASTLGGQGTAASTTAASAAEGDASSPDARGSQAASAAGGSTEPGSGEAQGENGQSGERSGGRRSRRGRRRGRGDGGSGGGNAAGGGNGSGSGNGGPGEQNGTAQDSARGNGRGRQDSAAGSSGEARDAQPVTDELAVPRASGDTATPVLDLPEPRQRPQEVPSAPDREGLDALSSLLDGLAAESGEPEAEPAAESAAQPAEDAATAQGEPDPADAESDVEVRVEPDEAAPGDVAIDRAEDVAAPQPVEQREPAAAPDARDAAASATRPRKRRRVIVSMTDEQ